MSCVGPTHFFVAQQPYFVGQRKNALNQCNLTNNASQRPPDVTLGALHNRFPTRPSLVDVANVSFPSEKSRLEVVAQRNFFMPGDVHLHFRE